ncbi:MAG: PsiF family protein [Acidithiobacillus caldus]|nr:PsiF family protein [Acidithiobacillus caldus]WMT48416.1 MAG: PsiF family protein [Acidithiobacillus caldus]
MPMTQMPAKEKAKAPHKLTAQQEKMRMCNQQAKGKKGEERKAFMRSCLSKKK